MTVERVDGVPIASVGADVDAANAIAVQELLAAALDPDANSLIVDLSDTRYIDSAGWDMLLRLGERLDRRRAKLALVLPPSSRLNRLVAIVGLPQALQIHPTLAAAQRHLARSLTGDEAVAPGLGQEVADG